MEETLLLISTRSAASRDENVLKYVKLCFSFLGQGFPRQLLPSSVKYNQFPSTVSSQTYEGYNNSRGHTRSE